MSTLTETKPWDLSHVLDFVNALATPGQHQKDTVPTTRLAPSASHPANGVSNNASLTDAADDDDAHGGVGLGNFGKVWEFLGTPAPTQGTSLLATKTGQVEKQTIASKLDYTSDGAAYTLSRGEPSSANRHPSFTDGTDGETQRPEFEKALSKTQKKRMRRKERREQELVQARLNGGRADAISESEAETPGRRTPAKKASAHAMKEKEPGTPSKSKFDKTELLRRVAVTKAAQTAKTAAVTNASTQQGPMGPGLAPVLDLPGTKQVPIQNATEQTVPANVSRQTDPSSASHSDAEETTSQAVNAVAAALAALKHGDNPASPSPSGTGSRNKKAPSTPTQTKAQPVAQTQPVQRTQVQTPQAVSKLKLMPASVGVQPPLAKGIANNGHAPAAGINPTAFAQSMHIPSGPPSMRLSTIPSSAKKPRSQPVIEPRIIRSGEDRHWALLMKLINVFGDDRKHLVSPMNMTTHNNDPKGIHVFVDASNIFIGFMDMLKQTRGIHPLTHLPQVHLSFDGLALLMERRRPVAKRVLAGSNPWLPEFDKAKAVGYEMNIFEKVLKARELTDRQLYFKDLDARRFGKGSKAPPPVHPSNQITKPGSPPKLYSALNGIGSGSGSGTETSTKPQYAPAKMIEQGVDEILHLKMLESVVDYEIPSTIVLATGDAAQAEYSLGFMAMVERALKKGWTVELVSWSKNINKSYIKSQWTEAWDGRFKIIYLDDFAEELLDM